MITVGAAPLGTRLKTRFASIFRGDVPDDAFWNELETTLISADVGVALTARLIEEVRALRSVAAVREALATKLQAIFPASSTAELPAGVPQVVLVVGVNGVGKTTTIAKLAAQLKEGGAKVLLVAADTFRAAAVEQLKSWGARTGIEVVAQGADADAAAVAFDGVQKAVAKGYDCVLIDTAGRLHTKHNLMDELKKVVRVIGKALPGAPHERIIVLDATVGGNGLVQAKQFHETVGLTGAVVAKLDGTAKGGVLFAVASELRIPITHIGVGEAVGDLRPFDPQEFVSAILSS